MEMRALGRTELRVSLICLGTMTWGEQNTAEDAFAQIERALQHGVNFIDLAEMYPVPPRAETQGATETIMGQWLAQNKKKRKQLIIASKVTGRSKNFDYLGRGETRLDRVQMTRALEGSLKRLQTDYIDLYQLHWPERTTNYFGQLDYTYREEETIALSETLEVLADFIREGKIRYIGLSNETPWGLMDAIRASEQRVLPRVVSIQNPYNLLNRSFEVGLAEIAIREQVGLLAYSPLAFGVLSGKYLEGKRVENTRLTLFDRFQRYSGKMAEEATRRYVEIAQEYGLRPAQMALAFINRQPFVTSNIIGATTLEQLEENLTSVNVVLPGKAINEINAVHREISNPCP
ncbi:MAG: NADP(H)-dependent aldo-keto reductase [Rickettsiales bacterium]|nr:NADP(H)-dependent aldo-keto reductase [Rickettsiales bacterium]